MSDTYQSRVFTFINSRTNRLKDTCAQGLRHLKVAVVWSGQILFYPLHLLAQTTKIFQPQLPAPPQSLALPQPVADINIEQALDLVAGAGYPITIVDRAPLTVADDWSIIDENLWNITHSNTTIEARKITDNSHRSRQVTQSKPTIRGLSSLLIDRQLVLVTTENEILDILTISQQQEIRRRIGFDLATTWHQWHTNKLATSHSSPQLSGNHQLLLTDATSTPQLATENNLSSNLFDSPRERLSQGWKNWLQKFNPKSPSRNPAIPPASIANIEPKSPDRLPSANYAFNPQPPSIDRFWELPQLPPIVETQPIPSQDRPVRAKISKLQPDWLKQWWNYYRDYLHIPSHNDLQIVHQPEEFQLIPLQVHQQHQQHLKLRTEQNPEQIATKQARKQQHLTAQKSPNLSKQPHQNLEYHQDWIEAESEDIGYSKSPIAKILIWLDRLVLRIENWLIKTWRAITNHPAQS
jgi:hypothetical protein